MRFALAIGILLSALVALSIGSALLQFADQLASRRPTVAETRPHERLLNLTTNEGE